MEQSLDQNVKSAKTGPKFSCLFIGANKMIVSGKPLGPSTSIDLAFPTTVPAQHMATICGSSLICCLKSEESKIKLKGVDFELQV